MKKLKIWSMMMLVVMALPMMVACGGDDDGGGGVSYTETEIVEMLTGKWEVYGELNLELYNTQEDFTFTDKYKGTIEFTAGKSLIFVKTEATPYEFTDNEGTYKQYLEDWFIKDYQKYTVLKKDGKSYISFASPVYSWGPSSNFEIVFLTKTTFKMILNEELYNSNDKSKAVGHVYMTIVSK